MNVTPPIKGRVLDETIDRVRRLPLLEIFGPTIQGEGAMVGRKTMFVRFGGCDYSCGFSTPEALKARKADHPFVCDSLYAVLPTEVRKHAKMVLPVDIVDELRKTANGTVWVTLSGGNPALLDLRDLVFQLHQTGFKVCVETQGSVWKDWLAQADLVTVSPKPPSSGMSDRLAPAVLVQFRDRIGPRNEKWTATYVAQMIFKVVVYDEKDYTWAKKLHQDFPLIPFYLQVCNSVEPDAHGDITSGSSNEELLARLNWLWDLVVNDRDMKDVAVLPQLHVLLKGNARGI